MSTFPPTLTPQKHTHTETPFLPYPRSLLRQTDGCTFEEESKETFNEQEAGWGAFWIISWSISTQQRKWHSEKLWSDKQRLFRKRTEEETDTGEEISGESFQGLSGRVDRSWNCERERWEELKAKWQRNVSFEDIIEKVAMVSVTSKH